MKSLLLSLIACAVSITCAEFVPSAAAAEPFPVLHTNDVILFQGDSITDGGRQRKGSDYNHIMGQCYPYIIAATIGAQLPERNLTFINRGNSGNTVVDLAARWQADTLALKPQLLSILIGVNDTLSSKGETVEVFEQTYDKLLADTIAALPGVKIVLGEPFLMPVGKYTENYAAQLAEVKKRADVVAKLAAKYNLPLVRYQQALDDACRKAPAIHWSWDGVHPTYAGHGLMTQQWLDTVNKFWPQG
jgi:lysophospholipase L1-like esterase